MCIRDRFRILARIFKDNLPPEYPYEVAGAQRTIKAEDFDDRVDVIPVSDPNIFSMAQRVTLAQTQLQLAQSNPQIHNLHSAYRRMYQALEVQNIDEVLPPPPQPEPLDPAIENARALMSEILTTFPEQDHDVHIRMHLMFMKTPLVMTSPQVMGIFYAHIMEHVSQKARKMVMQELQSLMAMAIEQPNVDPRVMQSELQKLQMQMQDPAQMERLVTMQQEEILKNLMPELMPPPNDPMSDPLVQIRMKELAVKEQELGRKVQEDQNDLGVEMAKMQQRAVTDAARIESQEEIAQNRNDVNRESKLIAVSILTSHTNANLAHFGIERREDLAKILALKADDAGLDGIVCSPSDIESIGITKASYMYITPGKRLGSKKDDHNRTFTPKQAYDLGADYIVVGRPISESDEPLIVLDKILSSSN